MKTSKEGILVLQNDKKESVAIVRRDDISGHNVCYKLSEFGVEDFEEMLTNK